MTRARIDYGESISYNFQIAHGEFPIAIWTDFIDHPHLQLEAASGCLTSYWIRLIASSSCTTLCVPLWCRQCIELFFPWDPLPASTGCWVMQIEPPTGFVILPKKNRSQTGMKQTTYDSAFKFYTSEIASKTQNNLRRPRRRLPGCGGRKCKVLFTEQMLRKNTSLNWNRTNCRHCIISCSRYEIIV
jgi:hypothetical protein